MAKHRASQTGSKRNLKDGTASARNRTPDELSTVVSGWRSKFTANVRGLPFAQSPPKPTEHDSPKDISAEPPSHDSENRD